MKMKDLADILAENPIIPAVKSYKELDICLKSAADIVFVLFGKVTDIDKIAKKIYDSGKIAIIHIDLIEGLSSKEVSIDFIKAYTNAAGIISTKAGLIKYAKNQGLLAVQRFFILDSLSFENAKKQAPVTAADAVEILPGVMPKVIRELSAMSPKPVIAGGLIASKEDVMSAINAGASAVSTTDINVWKA